MASKATLANSDDRPLRRPQWVERVRSGWNEFSRFLSDVRAEMRKVVTPSRKEVQATTSVVIIAVFLFGFYFFVVDAIFDFGLHKLLGKLGGF